MFQFPEFPFRTLCIYVRIPAHYGRWVAPFGYLRINVCLQLPAAFRSLPRPSSAPGAKASTLCSLLLDQHSSSYKLRAASLLPDFSAHVPSQVRSALHPFMRLASLVSLMTLYGFFLDFFCFSFFRMQFSRCDVCNFYRR